MARPRTEPDHGSVQGYNRGCRLPCCTEARSAYQRAAYRRRNPKPDALEVTCWCEATIVMVAPELVARGVTESCGLPACHKS